MDRRLIVVLMTGIVIAGVCVYRVRTNQPLDYDAQVQAATTIAPSPLFEGRDEVNRVFRLSSYLGRHRIIVVFYDGEAGADHSADLLRLQEHAEELKRQDVKVVAVSKTIPQFNREALSQTGKLPCPLITDVDGSIHERWGRMGVNGQPLTGLFLVDRKGSIAYQAGAPRPYGDFDALWKDVVKP